MRASTNPELVAAWATVPDVAKAQELADEAAKLRKAFPRRLNPADALADVQSAAIATFQSTGKWPSAYAKDAAKAHADALVWEAEYLALRRLEDVTKDAAENTRDVLSVDVLEHLHGRLTEVLGAAKSAGETLGDVTTAEAAIEAGADVLDAWRRLTGLLSDYRNIREAQWEVLRAVAGEDHRSRLNQWRREGHGELRNVRFDDLPGHVVDVLRSGAYDIEFLVYVAQSGAGYVPTSYTDVEDEATELVDAFDGADGPIDLSPVVLPPLEPRPAQTFTHSRTPHIDASQPAPARPTGAVPHPSNEPTTRDYFGN